MIRAAVASLVLVLLASCSSSPDYKSITCRDWLKMANDGNQIGTTLQLALDYETSQKIAGDTPAFADTISGVCGPTRLGSTKILDLRAQVADVFLSVHPEDAG